MEITGFRFDKRKFPGYNGYREYNRKTRVFVSPSGEGVWENLMNRRNRPVATFREAAYLALGQLGYTKADVKLRWDIHAGCAMCPCSGGFIMEFADKEIGRGVRHADFSVSFTL